MIGASVVLAGILAAAVPGRADVGCENAALLSGPPRLVDAVGAALRRQGVRTDVRAPCPVVRVDLRQVAGQIALKIVDPYGRRSANRATTAGAAATLIETWALPASATDVANSDPLAAELGVPAGAGEEGISALAAPRAADDDARALPVAKPDEPPVGATGDLRDRDTNRTPFAAFGATATAVPLVSLGIAGETSAGTDRSLSLGFNASGCVRVGPGCVGALFRLASAHGTNDPGFASLDRLGTDLMLHGSVFLRAGPVVLVPSLGVGLGWIRSRGVTATIGTDAGEEGGDEIEDDGGGLRAEASLTAALPVTRVLALTLTVGAGVVPVRPIRGNAEGSLPGEAWGIARGGLGLRWGL